MSAVKKSPILPGARVSILSSFQAEDVGSEGEVIGPSAESGQILVRLDGQQLARHFHADQLKVLRRKPHLTLVPPTAQQPSGDALSHSPDVSSVELCKGLLNNLHALADRLADQGGDVEWWIEESPTRNGKGTQYRRRYPRNSARKVKTEYISKDHLAGDRQIQALKRDLKQVREAIAYFEKGLEPLHEIELLPVATAVRGVQKSDTTNDAIAPADQPLRPFLKWAGNKTALAPVLSELFDPFRSTHAWVEPFVGAMGATLGVRPEMAVLNDSNEVLINLYRQIQTGKLQNKDVCKALDRPTFERIRDEFNQRRRQKLPLTAEDAATFYYLLRCCWRGLCRFNQAGEFNVNWGEYADPRLDHDFALYQGVLQPWWLMCGDFEALTGIVKSRPCFLYCDPPYHKTFASYSKGGFNWEDQVRLAEWCASLDCPVVVSNSVTDEVIELYHDLGFEIRKTKMRRSISSGSDRKPADEIIATRNLA